MGQQRLSTACLQGRLIDHFLLTWPGKDPPDKEKLLQLAAGWGLENEQWAGWAYDLGLLSEYEAECNTNVRYSVVKTHLWSHVADSDARDLMDRVVALTSRMYSVGTRFLGGWALENEELLKDKEFFNDTLRDTTFLKHAFRGVLAQGSLDERIANSSAFGLVRDMYPTIEELSGTLVSMDAWGNLVGALACSYKEALSLHVRMHLYQRILGHLKRFAVNELEATVVKENRKTILKYDDDKQLELQVVYASLTNKESIASLPDVVAGEVRKVLGFFTETELKRLPNAPDRLTPRLFELHLYLRSSLPIREDDPNREPDKPPDESKIPRSRLVAIPEAEARPQKVERWKGWSPMPIARLGPVHVTIDESKVFPAIWNQLSIIKGRGNNDAPSIQDFFGAGPEHAKARHRERRRLIRKRYRQITDAKRRQKFRKSVRENGLGVSSMVRNGRLRSVTTDGVALCMRYAKVLGVVESEKRRAARLQLEELKAGGDLGAMLREQEILKAEAEAKAEAKAKEEEARKARGEPKKRQVKVAPAVPDEESLAAFQVRTGARLIANDPGRANLFQLAERTGTSHRHMRMQRKTYREVGLGKRLQNRRSERKAALPTIGLAEGKLAESYGWKARTKEDYFRTLKTFATHGRALMSFYGAKVNAREKMLSYRRRDSVLTQRFAKILDTGEDGTRSRHQNGKGVILGWGNAGFAPTGRGETAVPTTRVAKLFARYLKCRGISFRIVSVDEYLTTRMCHRCQTRLLDVRDAETRLVIRGLKSCEKCSTKTDPVLLNRDANAAINILRCLEAMVKGDARPDYLCRKKDADEPVPKPKKKAATATCSSKK